MAQWHTNFDEVADSIRNGQRKQAFNQMQEIGKADMPAMLDYFADDLADTELALDAAKTFFRLSAR